MDRIRKPRWHLAVLVIAVPALSLAFGWTAFAASSPSPGASTSTSASPAVAGDPVKGQAVYNANCTACHGANLEGGIGPKLHPPEVLPGTVANPLDATFLTDVISNGLSGKGSYGQMPAWKGKLSDADIQNVVAFIFQSQTAPAGISSIDLARSNVLWVTIGIAVMCLLTYLLARYNMRWIARRAAARSGRP